MINHLWQSTVFAVLAAILTLAFRRNKAQVRYWLWFGASIKFLIPFSLLIALGSRLELRAPQVSSARFSAPLAEIAQPFPDTVPFIPPAPNSTDWVPLAVFGSWACGSAAIALMRLRGWLRIRAAVRASSPLEIPVPVDVRSAPGLREPGVVGFLRPILLLPEGIAECLTPRQLEAVLAHELCHVRRRDNLASAVHMIVEAVFWFHPLAWWIGARLVEERERACDEAVLSLGSEPQVYAEAILNVCKSYLESPLRCVSGVTGSDLKKRIQAILTGRVAGELNFAKRVVLAVAGTVALALPVIVGILNAPAIRAQSSAGTPKFEVASIRRCRDLDGVVGRGGGGGVTPGRLSLNCQSVAVLINAAYAIFANGRLNFPPSIRIEGGPDWINSERYTINAKPEDTPSPAVIQGPMLQALLEERFKLKVRRETREVPIYELTVAKGGIKMPRHKEGSCVLLPPIASGGPPPRPALPAGEKYCKKSATISGPNVVIDAQEMSVEEFAKTFLAVAQPWIQQWAGRPVIDKTGITETFDFHLEYALDEEFRTRLAADGHDPGEPTAPSIFTALQEQLGLKLESAKGLGEFVIIDSVGRPSEN